MHTILYYFTELILDFPAYGLFWFFMFFPFFDLLRLWFFSLDWEIDFDLDFTDFDLSLGWDFERDLLLNESFLL